MDATAENQGVNRLTVDMPSYWAAWASWSKRGVRQEINWSTFFSEIWVNDHLQSSRRPPRCLQTLGNTPRGLSNGIYVRRYEAAWLVCFHQDFVHIKSCCLQKISTYRPFPQSCFLFRGFKAWRRIHIRLFLGGGEGIALLPDSSKISIYARKPGCNLQLASRAFDIVWMQKLLSWCLQESKKK